MRILALLLLAAAAFAQGNRVEEGLSREQMWPAPTAEDWEKPCLISWQRTWEDAVAVSKETGKPILICINMDGEIASEHYAGIRYRQPEIAKLYEPYVCVIASVYRHNPRDYDDEGHRIECPRFGGVTCGEHIWIEPIIFEKFCDGRRIAPRHICVDLEGKEVYDVYYINDTAGVFDAIREGRKQLPPGRTIVRSDRPILERVRSRAAEDRRAVESAYRRGDAAAKEALLKAALEHPEAEPLDLLRLAIFGLDAEQAQLARRALTRVRSADGAGLVADALQVPMDQAEREALIATLQRLGELSPRARWLAGVHTGLAKSSGVVAAGAWSGAGAEYPAPFGGSGRVSHIEAATQAALERPEDPAARIDLAEATLAAALKSDEIYATNPRLARLARRHLLEDARRYAREAGELGAADWRAKGVQALASYYAGEREPAYALAAEAVPSIPPGDTGWNSMALLTVFAEGRWKAIRAAVREGKPWPPEWLSDLDSAYTVLLRHPLGTDGQVLWYYELLDWLGAHFRARRVLREGLARFPDSSRLHARLRERVLKFRGPDALESAYTELLKEDPRRMAPFAGLAAVAGAESHRRTRNWEPARAAYGRAIAHFESAGANDAAIALALAGRARVAYQLGDDEAALKDVLAGLARDPGTTGTRDGMGITPGETAQMLLARLNRKGATEAAAKLEEALARIDPDLLRPDIGLAEER